MKCMQITFFFFLNPLYLVMYKERNQNKKEKKMEETNKKSVNTNIKQNTHKAGLYQICHLSYMLLYRSD